MLTVTQWSVLLGFACTLGIIATTLVRHKRLDRADLGNFSVAYFAAANIPPAIFLGFYVFLPDPQSLLEQTRLAGYEKYLSFSGLALLILSVSGVWTMFRTAYARPAPLSTVVGIHQA